MAQIIDIMYNWFDNVECRCDYKCIWKEERDHNDEMYMHII